MSRATRLPAVSGLFYEADPQTLRRTVDRLLAGAAPPRRSTGSWRALLLPHAGYVYSGPIAAAGVAAVEWPGRAILIGPNHRGAGAAAALSPARTWRTPLGDVPVDEGLSEALLAACPEIEEDERAHREEHALEVLLPFLQAARPDLKIAALSIGEPSLDLCRAVGRAVARVVGSAEADVPGGRVALVVSSDLNHYLPRAANRKKDDRALDALLAGDPEELFDRVLGGERITMCGILPATALLEALKALGAGRAHVLAHGDSADASGDEARVVGYASVLWEAS